MLLKFTYATIILLLTLFAGVYPFKKGVTEHDHPFDFRSAESLACGVFLGAGLMHMLSEASELFHNQGYHYPIAFLLCGGVFLLFLWLEHLGKEYYHHNDKHNRYFALIAVAMMSIHSLLAGSALGLSDDISMITLIFLAIISHKLAESFAIAMQLIKSNLNRQTSIIFFLIFSSMTPIGIFLGASLGNLHSSSNSLIPIFSALAAGTFLYLGTLHGLEKCVLVKQCCNLKYFSFVILGFVVMAVMALYV